MEEVFKLTFDDSEGIRKLEDIEAGLKDVSKAAENVGEELDKAFSGDFALGVSDGINDLKKKYAELARASATLRTAIKSATDPTAIKLYQKALADVDAGMKTLETTAKKAGVNLKEVNKEVSTGKQVFRDFFGEFSKAALITVAINKVIEFTKYAVELADQTRLAQKQFEAFLGSAEDARRVVADLQGFAADKFLNTGDVLNAGKALVAFGEEADNLTVVLSRIADISAATGKNFNELVTIYGKARTAGVLYAEDINQLVEAGIPIIQEFAKQMGVGTDEVKKLASEGKISFEELQLAFFNLTKEGGKFADQAELNAFTVGGAWRGLLAELQPLIEGVGDFFSATGQKILNTTKSLVSDIKALFGATEEEVGAFFDIPIQKEKEALTEQQKLEEEARKRREQLARENSKKDAEAAAKRRKQRLEEFDRLLADVDAQAQALDIAQTFNPLERVQKEYAAAIAAARELEKSLLILADTPEQKEAVKRSIEALFDELLVEYNENLSRAEIELEKLKGGKIREALNPLPPLQTLRRDVTDVLTQLNQAANEFIEGQQPRSLAEILGISQESLEGLKDATAQIIDGLNQISEARLREAEAATRAAEQKVSAAEEALEKERDLARRGEANNSDLRKQELEKAKEQREEALKEQAKAARAQILLDSAQQVSGLATSSVNIFKSLSGLGPVGIGIAIATIATMFAAFAKAKSDAFKAAAVPKLRKGGKIQGRTHEQGGEMAATPEGDMFELERGEWVIGTQHSREQDKFLARLNKGEFKGIDLNEILSKPGASNPLPAAAARVRQIEQERREIEDAQNFRAMQAAYEKSADRIVKAIEEKPEIAPYKGGYRRFVKKGNVTEVTTVSPE